MRSGRGMLLLLFKNPKAVMCVGEGGIDLNRLFVFVFRLRELLLLHEAAASFNMFAGARGILAGWQNSQQRDYEQKHVATR